MTRYVSVANPHFTAPLLEILKPHNLEPLSLEFTRLFQLTRDPKYFDAVQRIMDIFAAQQMETRWPSLWPIMVDAETGDLKEGELFTVGGMADSVFEYLPKVRGY